MMGEAEGVSMVSETPAARVGEEIISLEEIQRSLQTELAQIERERHRLIEEKLDQLIAQKLLAAAQVIAVEPVAVQLRYLQTLTEIGTEQNTTVVFPIPIDMIKDLMSGKQPRGE